MTDALPIISIQLQTMVAATFPPLAVTPALHFSCLLCVAFGREKGSVGMETAASVHGARVGRITVVGQVDRRIYTQRDRRRW